MLITNDFKVDAPVEQVWRFFDDIPQVAACLPGAELTDELGEGKYQGQVHVRMGPVALSFDGTASITERDDAAKRIVVDASGSERKGKGTAAMRVTATLAGSGTGTTVDVEQDLQVSGAAAQYGRGMISDVSAVLMRQFADNMAARMAGGERGGQHAGAAPARGFSLGFQAALMALKRVFRRFFVPGVG